MDVLNVLVYLLKKHIFPKIVVLSLKMRKHIYLASYRNQTSSQPFKVVQTVHQNHGVLVVRLQRLNLANLKLFPLSPAFTFQTTRKDPF